MNSQENNNYKIIDQEDSLDLKQEFNKYATYWPWFLLSVALFLIGTYSYLRYAPRIYQTSAKIKILDESEGLELPTSAFVFKRVNINLENEVEILTSYLILERVVKKLNLTTRIYEEGRIQTSLLSEFPFKYEQKYPSDSIKRSASYQVEIGDKGFIIYQPNVDKTYKTSGFTTEEFENELPFKLSIENNETSKKLLNNTYLIKYRPLKSAVLSLRSQLRVESIGELSDLLKLTLKGENSVRSEEIINELINIFNNDGINDRQLVSKRTLNFIDERFVYLAQELDSIELNKKDFKQQNNLIYMETDAQLSLQEQTASDQEVFVIENQLAIANILDTTLKQSQGQSGLLPANIGIENSSINNLISQFNNVVLERDKLVVSGGVNNPSVKLLDVKINDLKSNITSSLTGYISQLTASQNKLNSRNRNLKGRVSSLPNKEKLLRAIDRQQKIKESLYLLLLQKREEAAINLAITEPSIKVVEYALSGSSPVSPKSTIFYAGSFLLSLLLPFGVLYLLFALDTKLHSKEDIQKLKSNSVIVAEIPDIKSKSIQSKMFDNPNDKTMLAESFRILSSNVNFMLTNRKDGLGNVIYCTSTIKGEGKTYVSVNLSLALSSINKRVLLIGADLRNPQIHTHINVNKQQAGLTNYLHDDTLNWRDTLIKGFEKHVNHYTIISGPIPPNPAHLLTNGKFEKLLEEAKQEFDYIVVDTAPTILVTDTMLISQYADATLYITRANYTEKNLLNFSEDLKETGKLKNLAYVVNGVGATKSKKYGYNYGYGYGYGAKSE